MFLMTKSSSIDRHKSMIYSYLQRKDISTLRRLLIDLMGFVNEDILDGEPRVYLQRAGKLTPSSFHIYSFIDLMVSSSSQLRN